MAVIYKISPFFSIPTIIFFSYYLYCLDILNVDVLYNIDDQIILPTCVSIVSLLNSTTDLEKINIHFLEGSLSRGNLNELLFLKEKIRSFDIDCVAFDLSRLEKFDTGIWNKKIMVKLYAAELFPNVEKILYLDSDVLILQNIRELFETDLEGKYVAAVNYGEIIKFFGKKCPVSFHGGVMLFNLKLIRNDGLQEVFVRYGVEFGKSKGREHCGGIDEFSVTKSVGDKAVMLPYRYNIIADDYSFALDSWHKALLKRERLNIVILHFSGKRKPWVQRSNVRNKEYLLVFDCFLRMSKLEGMVVPSMFKIKKSSTKKKRNKNKKMKRKYGTAFSSVW